MGKFYFCTGGCNRKYQAEKSWVKHMENEHGIFGAVLPVPQENIKGKANDSSQSYQASPSAHVERPEIRSNEPGMFFFCKGGCNRKYLTSKNWYSHMENSHQIFNMALPAMEKNNISKGTRRLDRQKISHQRNQDRKMIEDLQSKISQLESSRNREHVQIASGEAEIQKLQNQVKELESRQFIDEETIATGSLECIICLEPTTTAILPCGHTCLCDGCSASLHQNRKSCPICRGPITKCQKLFFATM